MSTRLDSMIQHKNKFDVIRVLKSVPLLSGISSSERSQLSTGLCKISFIENDYIMREGEEGSTFYIIVSGSVSVLVNNGSEMIGTLTSGDYCGEQALLQNTTRNASLKCISSNVECLMCKQNIFRNILENNSSIQFAKRNPQRNAFVSNDTMNNEKKENNNMNSSTIKWLLGCINSNALFCELTHNQKKEIFKYMKLLSIKCDEIIISQHDINDLASTFYIVESGEYDTFIDGVRRPSSHYTRGGWFGELALLHNSPRAATIKCISNCGGKLWQISRKNYRYALKKLKRKEISENILFLRTISLFKPLLDSELLYLNDALTIEIFNLKKGEIIYKQNDLGLNFYVIKKGEIKWSKNNNSKEEGILSKGQFFGERALRMNCERAATITIATNAETILLSMNKTDFEELLGNVIQIIDDKINEYKRREDIIIDDDDIKEEDIIIEKKEKEIINCKLSEFITIGILGRGGFGLVTLVENPYTNKTYALKAIEKYKIIENNLQQHIISEKNVMYELGENKNKNNFLVNLYCTYKNKLRIYFLLDVCLGGELFTILRKRRYFNEKTTKFYIGSVIEGFEYMHSKNIIYRDMKPENLVLDSNGYLKITDFGFAKKINNQTNGGKTFTFCGTPDYLCPEIIIGAGHGKPVDWWTLGILIYELLASFAPFVAEKPIQTYKKILKGKIRFPKFFTKESKDLIYKLLQHKPYKRLGIINGGVKKIKKHIWFKGFNWKKLQNKTMKPPIINKVKSQKDLTNFKLQQHHKIDKYAKEIDPKDEFDQTF